MKTKQERFDILKKDYEEKGIDALIKSFVELETFVENNWKFITDSVSILEKIIDKHRRITGDSQG